MPRKGAAEPHGRPARLPAAPLLDALTRRQAVAPGHTTLHQQVTRARREGTIGIYQADEVSVRLLGVHPACVYGEQWWEAA